MNLFPSIQAEQALPVLMMNMLSPLEQGIVGSALLARVHVLGGHALNDSHNHHGT